LEESQKSSLEKVETEAPDPTNKTQNTITKIRPLTHFIDNKWKLFDIKIKAYHM